MRWFQSLVLVATLAVGLTLTGCGPTPPKTDGGTGGGAGGQCFENTDCPDSQLFFCNTTTSTCEPSCRTKADCTAAVRGEFALAYCDNSSLGCQCDEGKCVGSLCSSDADCGTQVCRNGACVADPAQSTVAKCSITPDFQLLPAGGKAKFWVSAWDSANNPIVLKSGATWSGSNGMSTTSGAGNSAEFTAGSTPTTGAVTGVTAAFGTINCTAQVQIVAATASSGIVAVVTDELTGRPISNATVMVSDVTTGADLGNVTSGTNGVYTVTVTGTPAKVTVTAFHADYNYLTIGNYDTAGASRVLSMVLRRNQTDKYGGQKGTFKDVPQTSNVHAGIAGMSLAGSITDLSLTQLLGPSEPTDITIGTAINQQDVPVPAGVYLGFTEQVIKSTVSAQGLAGVCKNTSGAPDETAIAAGTCGTRTAWALAGDVPLGDLPIDAFAGGTNNIDFGKVLSRIIPIFKRFNSSVVRDVKYTLKNTPVVNGKQDFSDTSSFTTADHDFDQMPLAFNFATRVPALPKFKNTYVDGVVLLGGANMIGQGVVPLGIGVAVNTTPVDDKTDTQASLPATGLVSTRMAPTHHGLEGQEYGVVALALSLKSVTDSSAGVATSGIYGRISNNQLKFDPAGATPVDLGSTFMDFPEGGKFNFTATAQPGLPARTFRIALPTAYTVSLAGTTFVRAVFTDSLDHRWVVYADAAEANSATGPGVRLPAPPSAFQDRTFASGTTNVGPRAPMLVQTIRLNSNPTGTGTAVTYRGLVELNDTNYDRITQFLTGFAFIDVGRPDVEFKTPATAGSTVAKSSSVVVTVTGFKVGSTAAEDGFVKLSFTGGGCTGTDVIDAKTDTSNGKGEISIPLSTLGSACTGSVTMKATLYDNQSTPAPLAPEASTSLAITLQ